MFLYYKFLDFLHIKLCPFKGIVKFNKDRNLNVFYHKSEVFMLEEEISEFKTACDEDNFDEKINALCDIIVLAVGALHKLDVDPKYALNETVREITSRKGVINLATGKWEKDVNQDKSTMYKPDYKKTMV